MSVRIQNIKTIDDVYKFRLEKLKENRSVPRRILLSEEQRKNLIQEAILLPLDQSLTISNLNDSWFGKHNKFKLFNILITTEERERK